MEIKSNLAIICVRSQSKGIPGKNIKEFCGKPQRRCDAVAVAVHTTTVTPSSWIRGSSRRRRNHNDRNIHVRVVVLHYHPPPRQ